MKTCTWTGCSERHLGKGFCGVHYQRDREATRKGVKGEGYGALMDRPIKKLGSRKVKHNRAARTVKVKETDDEVRLRVPLKTSEWDRLKVVAKTMNLVLPESAPKMDAAMIIAIVVRKHFGWRE